MRFGLLGEKLGHSYSPELHAFFGDYEYELFEVAPDQLGDFIRNGDFQGLNVTIPYKTTMLALCDDLTEAAAAIGSVNTVVRHPDGSLFGDNTDAAGFEGLVWKSRISIRGRKCLVLGSGVCAAQAGGGGDRGDLPVRPGQLREPGQARRRRSDREHHPRGDVPQHRRCPGGPAPVPPVPGGAGPHL